jgi:hypothetical protein
MIARIIAVCLLLFPGATGVAQICFPVKKTHAYFQPVTPGNAARDEAKLKTRTGNYYLYMESRRQGISVSDVWINGAHFRGTIQKVSSPVLLPSAHINPAVTDKDINKVLVPPTKRFVYQLLLNVDSTTHGEAVLPEKYSSNPLVLKVNYRNRIKYIRADEIIQLDPIGML